MRTPVPEKILEIVDDLDLHESVPLTRLTVLEKWFINPCHLPAFGLWVARRASGRKGKTGGIHGQLLDEAKALLGTGYTAESLFQQIDRGAALDLAERARLAQNEFKPSESGPVRVIPCWQLFLVESGLTLHAVPGAPPAAGCQLAADFLQSRQPRPAPVLSGSSRGKLMDLTRFMFNVEAAEDFVLPQPDPGT